METVVGYSYENSPFASYLSLFMFLYIPISVPTHDKMVAPTEKPTLLYHDYWSTSAI